MKAGKQVFRLALIVEGHGEQQALPILVKRWLRHRNFTNFSTNDLAIRTTGAGAFTASYDRGGETGIEHYVDIALLGQPDAILILRDAEDDCLRNRYQQHDGLGPYLLARATAHTPHVPIAVVIVNRSYEAWLLGANKLFSQLGIFKRLPRENSRPEALTGNLKRHMKKALISGTYSETADQIELTRILPLTHKQQKRCPTLERLFNSLEKLCRKARQNRRQS